MEQIWSCESLKICEGCAPGARRIELVFSSRGRATLPSGFWSCESLVEILKRGTGVAESRRDLGMELES